MSEQVVTFGTTRRLVGVLHRPAAPRPDLPVAVMLNAGILHRVGPNRLYVVMARQLAELGFSVLRFDVWGIGDSQDHTEDHLAHTFVDDTLAAFAMLAEQCAATEFLVMGICMGARIGLEVAARDPRVTRLVLMEGIYIKSLRYHASRLLAPAKWARVLTGRSHFLRQVARRLRAVVGGRTAAAAPSVRPTLRLFPDDPRSNTRAKLRALLDRGVEILLAFRAGNEIAHNYRLRRTGRDIVAVGTPRGLEVAFIPFADHTFTPLVSQALLLARVASWLEQRDPRAAVAV